MLRTPNQPKVADNIEASRNIVDQPGRRLVVRPPKYLRKTKFIEDMIPWLYLKCVSTNVFQVASQWLPGTNANQLTAPVITRLKTAAETDGGQSCRRSVAGKCCVYLSAGGSYCNARFTDNKERIRAEIRQRLPGLSGTTAKGRKDYTAVLDRHRKTDASRNEILLSPALRGRVRAPELATGNEPLVCRNSLKSVFPGTSIRKATVPKTPIHLNHVPRSLSRHSKPMLRIICEAPTKHTPGNTFAPCRETVAVRYEATVQSLRKNRDSGLASCNFPAEKSCHVHTEHATENAFATMRRRHQRIKGTGTTYTSVTGTVKPAQSASKNSKKLRGHHHMADQGRGTDLPTHSKNGNPTTKRSPLHRREIVA